MPYKEQKLPVTVSTVSIEFADQAAGSSSHSHDVEMAPWQSQRHAAHGLLARSNLPKHRGASVEDRAFLREGDVGNQLPQLQDVRSRTKIRRNAIHFHQESCRLFQSSSAPTSRRNSYSIKGQQFHPQSTILPGQSERYRSSSGSLRSSRSEVLSGMPRLSSPGTITRSDGLIPSGLEGEVSGWSEDKPDTYLKLDPVTVLTWTSDESRKAEYEKIDRGHSGLRGLWKQIMPRWCHSKNARRGFYDGRCDGGSVRRFRLSLLGDKEKLGEKGVRAGRWTAIWSCLY